MAVADQFLARSGNAVILDSTDFTIIAEWEKQGIPLAVVLASISEAYDELEKQYVKVRSVTDLQNAVRQRFFDWLQTNAEGQARA